MTSDAERWARVREIFEAAQALEGDRRSEFVSAACGGDPTIRQEVEALLAAAEDDEFLSEPLGAVAAHALDQAVESGTVGARVGPYRLMERLGAGGMGAVYLAERADGAFRQRVAVKLIRAAFPNDELVRRFTREREILASLNHPNIAHLLDGGVSDSGPYLAMEFVEGRSIYEYCDAGRMGVRDRLALFATVRDAVHFAHQKFVVHRDLKPSHVLVSDRGRVKLLDFGIAGLLGDQPSRAEPLTRTGRHLMTPEYASPEQVRGHPVSTASDIYSLGVLLYELLTGQRPYDLQGLSPAEVERRIAEEPATRPSEAVLRQGLAPVTGEPTASEVSSGARARRPDRLHRSLRGDLDTIVLRAMHKDPPRRYELATDVRRHLANKPVLARRDTVAYRLSTFLRRRRPAVIAAAVVLLTILTGAAATA